MTSSLQPIIFIDMDDVLVVSREFTSYQVITAFKLNEVDNWPELWEGLLLAEARTNLAALHEEFSAQYVISSSWSKHLTQEQMTDVFRRTELDFVADNLHDKWATQKSDASTRAEEIEAWIDQHGQERAFLVLDDELSGESLAGSILDQRGYVVRCKPWVGFVAAKLNVARQCLLRRANSRFILDDQLNDVMSGDVEINRV